MNSNQKQIGTSILLYLTDWDDTHARRSGCELNSSLNPTLNDGTLRCSGGTGFAHSMTRQSWQKYYMPYMKNALISSPPSELGDANDWNNNGQIRNSFAINLGLVGAETSGFLQPTFGQAVLKLQFLNVFKEVWLLAELPHTYGAPFLAGSGGSGSPVVETVYPMAIREYWRAIFLVNAGGCNTTEEIDPTAAPLGGVILGMADGSARVLSGQEVLAETPTLADYYPAGSLPGNLNSNCRRATSAYVSGPGVPNTNINAPLWALAQ
ncbi:MAG: hypothetical protein R2688_08610 [Fimbriimonadaceae bacterium]